MSEPITNLSDAVAALGALPMPVGTEPQTDTLAAWLYQRFNRVAPAWESLSEDDRLFWEHEAAAVRRAVARGGFRADGITRRIAPSQALREPEGEFHSFLHHDYRPGLGHDLPPVDGA